MDSKVPITLTTYPELHQYIEYIVRLLEIVYDKGRVQGLKEAEESIEGEFESDQDVDI